ncbi:MAG: rhodanese-like domain-containing protein [Acidimicrobiia bacterium]
MTASYRSVDEFLGAARDGLHRLAPADAAVAMREGGLLIDIRPTALRQRDGGIPGAIVIERNVLEWRLAPSSAHRISQVDAHKTVVIVCDEGYASSLAAATLQQLGLPRATDVIGGFQAWKRDGLPITSYDSTSEHRS